MEFKEAGCFVQAIVDAVEGPLLCSGKDVGRWPASEFIDAAIQIIEAVNVYSDKQKARREGKPDD